MKELTAADIACIRTSFDRLWPVSEQTVAAFYDRLFTLAPEVRALFRADMDEQKKKFIATLATIVGSLDKPELLLPAAERLAQHHVQFGVEPGHYAIVGDALLWSLQQGLGPAWTPTVADSWERAYRALAGYMIAHAYA